MDRFYGRGNLLPVLQTGRFGVSAVVPHASVAPGRVCILALWTKETISPTGIFWRLRDVFQRRWHWTLWNVACNSFLSTTDVVLSIYLMKWALGVYVQFSGLFTYFDYTGETVLQWFKWFNKSHSYNCYRQRLMLVDDTRLWEVFSEIQTLCCDSHLVCV
jgi:hypothetical protein